MLSSASDKFISRYLLKRIIPLSDILLFETSNFCSALFACMAFAVAHIPLDVILLPDILSSISFLLVLRHLLKAIAPSSFAIQFEISNFCRAALFILMASAIAFTPLHEMLLFDTLRSISVVLVLRHLLKAIAPSSVIIFFEMSNFCIVVFAHMASAIALAPLHEISFPDIQSSNNVPLVLRHSPKHFAPSSDILLPEISSFFNVSICRIACMQ